MLKALAFSLFTLISQHAHADFLPPNNLNEQDNILELANINESQFDKIVLDIVAAYKPIFRAHGVTLTPNLNWNDSTVNANATRPSDTDWQITMYGGLARRPEVTQDGFALVVCHELGHHLGGFPYYGATIWPAVEGQADYFAAHSCARFIWQSQKEQNNAAYAAANAAVTRTCNENWTRSEDRALCARTLTAGESLSALLAVLGNNNAPHIETPDSNIVNQTVSEHPEAQCRLDTYVQGALCHIPFDRYFIPGIGQPSHTSLQAEVEAFDHSCARAGGDVAGTRPRCWFAPRLSSIGVRAIDLSPLTVAKPSDLTQLQIEIKNRSPESSPATHLTLSSANGRLHFQNTTLAVPSLAPASVTTSHVAVTNSLRCGERALVNVSSQDATSPQQYEVQIGEREGQFGGSISTTREIPDNSSVGVKTSLQVSGINRSLFGAKLLIRVDHGIPSDLGYVLLSPSGKSSSGRFPSAPGSQHEFLFDVPADETSGNGTWQLTVTDASSGDVGKLLGWQIDFETGFCTPH